MLSEKHFSGTVLLIRLYKVVLTFGAESLMDQMNAIEKYFFVFCAVPSC